MSLPSDVGDARCCCRIFAVRFRQALHPLVPNSPHTHKLRDASHHYWLFSLAFASSFALLEVGGIDLLVSRWKKCCLPAEDGCLASGGGDG